MRLTLAALARPDDVPEELLAHLQQRLSELQAQPAAAARSGADRPLPGVAARCRPSTTRQAVARAVELIRAGELEKIVLAREVQVHAPRAIRPGRAVRRAARGVPVVLRLLRRARRRHAHRRQPRAARAPRGPPREHARARRLDAPQRRPRGRRPPRRAAAARRELPRGARDRRAADRAHAAPARRLGHRRTRARARARSPTSSTSPRRSARSSPRRSTRSSWRA